MIKAYSLFSGSSGNCFYIDAGDEKILIDAGVSARRISCALKALGSSLDDISAIFLTHEHIDHTRGLETISKNHTVPIHATVGTARAIVRSPSSPLIENLYAYRDCFSVGIGALNVSSFPTSHDAAQPVGYTVEKNGVRIGFCTDTGCITETIRENLASCRAAVIESNHDERLLLLGSYPYQLKMRILSEIGHLSNDAAANLASFLSQNGTTSLLLAHLSRENNSPEIALDTVKRAVGNGVRVVAASPDETTELFVP